MTFDARFWVIAFTSRRVSSSRGLFRELASAVEVKTRRTLFRVASVISGIILAGSAATAGSIQQPGLTTGLPEGYAPTESLIATPMLNFGGNTAGAMGMSSGTFIPGFINWSTPWELLGARVQIKSAPFVLVNANSPRTKTTSLYSPYAGFWLSWYLGDGFNLAIGEGGQFGVDSKIGNVMGRNFNAFQQNVAITYLRDNLNFTANTFYTTGNTSPSVSQPNTFNVDLTATVREGRLEYGLIGFGQWDLNRPRFGYEGLQSQVGAGALVGYLIGNQITIQAKLTHTVYQRHIGGNDTRGWLQLIVPLWSPPAPSPRNAF